MYAPRYGTVPPPREHAHGSSMVTEIVSPWTSGQLGVVARTPCVLETQVSASS
jgi:hypothetical protein